ncbi:MAG: SDR family NAD(P)-dependent oxidoreductase [Acholeplasmataceae bacterium]|nr:SDR family NAD(P)-dependent oxidoreductase [Acholeplasmataceae bacterium]
MILKDKKIVLTGASSGIGKALMLLLLKEGAYVLAASRTIESTTFVHERLTKVNLDLSNKGDVQKLFEEAAKVFSGIDIMIANAGFTYYERLTEANWQHINDIVDLNLNQTMYCAIRLKEMKKDQPFQFMATLSAVSHLSLPGYALYSATKAGLKGFMDGFRLEMGKGQVLQSVYPVATHTKFFDRAGQNHKPWPVQTPEHVALVMLKALKSQKHEVYPSRLFRIGFKLAPWFFKLYVRREKKIFDEIMPESGHKR